MNTNSKVGDWFFVGIAEDLADELESSGFLKEFEFDNKKVVLSFHDGNFGALNNKCNHMGGPLAKGKLKKGCIECPWHYWQFNHKTGSALENSAEPLSSHPGVVPQFPFVAHSLGWSAEEMEHNMDYVKNNENLHEQSFKLLQRSIELSKKII